MRSGSVAGLATGGVLVRDVTAEQEGLVVGDALAMRFARTGTQSVPVVGTFHNGDAPPALQSDFLISLRTYEENFSAGQQLDSSVFVEGDVGVPLSDVRREIDGIVKGFPTARVMDQAQLKAEQAKQIDQLMGLMTALLLLAVVIGLVGIANTLSLSILERTRELGLLRAVGMTRHQARSMIRWEAAVVSLLGAVLGIAIGVLFGWAVVTSMQDSGITVFAVPGVRLALFGVLAGLAGVLAALPPARRAAKLDVLRAVAAE
jgi:putative ABC transport system permease protein